MKNQRTSLKDRLDAKVMPIPWSGCWIWTGATTSVSKPYGRIGAGGWHGKNLLAHRVSYELAFGPIPSGVLVCHRCDVSLCVNPEHLFLGTHKDNSDDMDSKGRRAPALRGERSPRAKLSMAQVEEIRSDKRALKDIALTYGMSISQIHNIKSGAQWVRK